MTEKTLKYKAKNGKKYYIDIWKNPIAKTGISGSLGFLAYNVEDKNINMELHFGINSTLKWQWQINDNDALMYNLLEKKGFLCLMSILQKYFCKYRTG
ncbi:MAG: hypothetical protein A2452_11035 [Candidatus Firestonebacteria bacterium RIFOXYC2_FULL_39_67]|nr:MAG: hypothetical protein A2452_11035 [Candidatus Firestonebacteria bacterium RIFOXYC2_FULL_39_67]